MWPFTKPKPEPEPVTTETTVVTIDDKTTIPGMTPRTSGPMSFSAMHKAPQHARHRLDIWKQAGFVFLKETQLMIPWEPSPAGSQRSGSNTHV